MCLHPILDRHGWEDDTHWHDSGLFDVASHDGSLDRSINTEYEAALRDVQARVAAVG